MKIGILACGITPDEIIEDFGTYAEMIAQLVSSVKEGFEFETFDVRDGHFPESANTCDGWIISGSKFCVGEQSPWMIRLQELIVEIYAQKVPTVGICFGHQIVAVALGGRVDKCSGGWGVGLHRYETITDDVLFSPLKGGFTLNAMHQDQVVELPKSAGVLASSEFCAYAAINYSDVIFTIQAHPEFSMVFEYLLVSLRRGSVIPEGVADTGLASLRAAAAQADSQRVAECIVGFLSR